MMNGLEIVLALHVLATLGMTGVIWFVQVVHYPLFARVPESEFSAYHRGHLRRTGWVVMPLMLVELVTAVLLVVGPAPGGAFLPAAGLSLLAVVWLSTFLLQVPLHRRLENATGDRESDVRALVKTNWVRTIVWSARSLVAVALLIGARGG